MSRSWAECAELRCLFAADRVDAAEAPAVAWLAPLLDAMVERASAGNGAGTATLLGAIAPRLSEPPATGRGQPHQALRTAALTLEAKLAPVLDPLGRCAGLDAAQAAALVPCALDTWRLALAPAAGRRSSRDARRRVGTGAGGPGHIPTRRSRPLVGTAGIRSPCLA